MIDAYIEELKQIQEEIASLASKDLTDEERDELLKMYQEDQEETMEQIARYKTLV